MPANKLTTIMRNACEDILWPELINKNPQFNDLRFSTRAGSGRATYCRYNRKTNEIQITFGKKMIESKFNHSEASLWLSYREIIKRRYFDGEQSLLNLLTHTVLHEFAHVHQQLHGELSRGSIHNQHFYLHLDKLHHKHSKPVRELIKSYCKKHAIDLEYHNITDKTVQQPLKLNTVVEFYTRKQTHRGTIIKINPKTVIVKTRSWRGSGLWRIPKSLVSIAS